MKRDLNDCCDFHIIQAFIKTVSIYINPFVAETKLSNQKQKCLAIRTETKQKIVDKEKSLLT